MGEIYINDEISKYYGIRAKDVIAQIDELPQNDELKVRYNTPGGSIFEAVHIYNRLVRFSDEGGTVVSIIEGLAGSCGSWLIMTGNKIQAYANTSIQMHRGQASVYGNTDELLQASKYVAKLDGQILDMFEARTNLERSKLENMLKGDSGNGSTITASEALELGFIDELLELKTTVGSNATNQARHDFANSIERMRLPPAPAHLVDENCDCETCKNRRAKYKNRGDIEKQIQLEAQRRGRMLDEIDLLTRS